MNRLLHDRGQRPVWRAYAASVLFVLLATLLSHLLRPWFATTPLSPYYAAVALSAWYGRLGSSLLAMILSVAAYGMFADGDVGLWPATTDDTARIAIFVCISLFLAALSTSRDRADEALRSSERRFRTMLETANEGVWHLDSEGRTQYANDRLAALLGTSSEEIQKRTVLDFIAPEDVAAARTHLATNLAGVAEEFEFRIRRADGHELRTLAATSPMRDSAGRISGALWLLTDISARVEAEEALRLLEAAGVAMASSLDYEETLRRVAWLAVPVFADWCIVDLVDDEDQLQRVAVAHADPSQRTLADLVTHSAPLTDDAGPEKRVIQTGESLLIERVTDEIVQAAIDSPEHVEFLRQYGVTSVMIVPLRSGGQVHGAMTLAATSISNRHFDRDDLALAEQLGRRSGVAIQNARLYREAQAAEARYRNLFEGVQDGILVADANGQVIDTNKAISRLSGYPREELLQMRADALTANAFGAQAVDQPGDAEERRSEWELRRKDGSTVVVESESTLLELPDGEFSVFVIRDVSERKRLERLQEEFVSALAHDLRNPLAAARAQAQLMRRRIHRGSVTDPQQLDSGLDAIEMSTTRMTTMLDELSDVMRLRAGQEIELARAPTDLVELTRRIVAEQQRATGSHTITLSTDLEQLEGDWDGPRLERVLANLLNNAIKYSPNGGEITVRLACETTNGVDVAVLSVEDRGVGIPEADLGLIFERYRRARNVANVAGSGIGLAGAKRIVELHGGTIEVQSAEGRGSTFSVRLPMTNGR